ncbi:pilus assembly protein N-terminal domain-containing protein [bacterium]|nr:pilus assembly protein N-terminal domain-containing protein [bacterium]
MKKSIILLIILFIISLITSQFASASDFDYKDSPVPQFVGADKTDILRHAVTVSPYKDNNEKLYSTVGKSQLIKFDEPVTRISITNPAIADIVLLSPKELLLNGKKAGSTSLVFWGHSGKPVFFNLVVQQDTDAMMQAIQQVAPNENIKYTFTDDGLIMSGHVSSTTVKNNIENIVKAYNMKLVDLTESPTKQVLLEVKITEASRNFTRTLSSKFCVGQNYGEFVTNTMGLTNTYNKLNSASFGGSGGQYLFSSSSAKVAYMLDAAESKGYVKILAEPKLLAVDGKEGSFNVGNEVPVPSSTGSYGNVAYTFKETGVILKFTPTILEKSDRIVLKLSPEVSEIDSSYTSSSGVPGFKTRKVDTTVELADGETLVIAGLLSNNSSKSVAKIPWLGDIPGLGFLFSNITHEKKDTELVIFITPKIIEAEKNADRTEL